MRRAAPDAAGADGKATENGLRDAYRPHYRAQVLARAQSAALTSQPFAERLVHFWANHFAISSDKGIDLRPGRHARKRGHPAPRQRPLPRPADCGRAAPGDDRLSRQPSLDGPDSTRRALRAGAAHCARPTGRTANSASTRTWRARSSSCTRWASTAATRRRTSRASRRSSPAGRSATATGASRGGRPADFSFAPTARARRQDVSRQALRRGRPWHRAKRCSRDLARHPSTARFLATKLARHFVADEPPAAAVDRVAHAYRASDGDLPAVYAALHRLGRRLGAGAAQIQDARGPRVLDPARLRRRARQSRERCCAASSCWASGSTPRVHPPAGPTRPRRGTARTR